ncbi:MAG: acetyltransferase [Proteobacteria bacterium]|nr:acetyltransferase [Pseudomonadota bacterium]MBU1647862.1 acetyltransferase [Pseudomonadota bacterium]MBU1986946.1 acetyltransferase [Pseudomonadota bacterium]
MHYDIFNGDSDGICALHQLRLDTPCPDAILITGPKRDITLLSTLQDVKQSSLTVLDLSLESNRPFLEELLSNSNEILYIDHHFSGVIPETPALTVHINTSPDTCTSLIVDSLLQGRYRKWAIVAAFGDNLHDAALKAAQTLSLSRQELKQLQELGELLNYNGYGATLADLYFHPADLYRAIRPFADPLDFINSSPEAITLLRQGFQQDMLLALRQKAVNPGNINRIFHFPDTAWSRRVCGVFANLKAQEKKEAAHALIVDNEDSTLRISVRAPLADKKKADALCRAFPTGGGRAAAAGINKLPPEMLDEFITAFHATYD